LEQEEEVEALIEVGEREGLLEAEEGAMMRGIVDLDETRVREIMTPRTDIIALPEETSVEQARDRLLEAGYTKLPVFRESIDNVVGVLHARDLFRAWEQDQPQAPISHYLRPVIHVPENLSAAQLLSEMRTKTKMVLVVDEFGGISGLVTLEDLLEEIVGEIRDEHEQEEEDPVLAEPDGSYLVRALAHVEELERIFGVEFEDRDYDTVGGLVVSAFGRVPSAGESIDVLGLRIEVVEAEKRRILQVRVRPQEPAPGTES
jgi:CBS domain containing-hemolysin-like protein